MQEVIRSRYRASVADGSSLAQVEVNALKWLFGSEQGWSSSQAVTFLADAWNVVGFS